MSKCNWDPAKHGGRECPIHGAGGSMWDENILTKQDKINKLKEKGYTEDEIEEELKGVGFDDDFEFDEEEFVNNLDETDWDKAEKNEEKNKGKHKHTERKDKYGNALVSDEAFKAGQKGAKAYLNDALKYDDLDTLKKSNIFLGGLRQAASKAIIEEGYDPDLDITYQDLNEIIGSVLDEDVDLEEYERNATKGFTGKKYSGYQPNSNETASNDNKSMSFEDAKAFIKDKFGVELTQDLYKQLLKLK